MRILLLKQLIWIRLLLMMKELLRPSDDKPEASSSIEYVSNSSFSYDLALAAERGDRAYEFDETNA